MTQIARHPMRMHVALLGGVLTVISLTNQAMAASIVGEQVVAVLSDGPAQYQAAFESFQKEFDAPVAVFHLPKNKPVFSWRTKIVVVFGGEALLEDYPDTVTLIACLTPGFFAQSRHGGPSVYVAMKPPPHALLSQLRKLQPNLKRLSVFWNTEVMKNYLKQLRHAAAPLGIEILDTAVNGPGEIPNVLRSQVGKTDALWLPPEPSLITPESFQTIKQFSWDNHIPFYAPTAGLAFAGAVAAVTISPEKIGKEAARVAHMSHSKEPIPKIVFPTDFQLIINSESASKAGLIIAPEVLEEADKVIR